MRTGIISLGNLGNVTRGEFRKAILSKEDMPGKGDRAGKDAEPPEFDDEEGVEGGPEGALKPAVVAAFKAWLAAHKGTKPPKGQEWTSPESETETAAQFAVRAAAHFADDEDAKDAIESIGEGPDFEDWIAAVMRYEGGTSEIAKSLAASIVEADEMCKALGGNGTGLSTDEAMDVLGIRLMNLGESWGKCGRRKNPQTPCTCTSGYCVSCSASEPNTIDEYADNAADNAVDALLWQDGPCIKVMRKLGGVVKYHDWTREKVIEGYARGQEGGDSLHDAIGAESDAAANARASGGLIEQVNV